MNPRLSSSKKFTKLPAEMIEQIINALKDTFNEHLQISNFIAEGKIFPQEILLRVGFVKKGNLKQSNFEASLEFNPQKNKAIEMIHICLDATTSMMNEFLQNEDDVDFPYQWKASTFDERKIYLQYSTVNTQLEAEADRILGIQAPPLVEELDTKSEPNIDTDINMDMETYSYVQGVLDQNKKIH